MSEVTVAELADVVGTPVDRLLKQMGEAGLSHSGAEQVVSDEDKKVLLAHLKNSHGDTSTAGSPKRITLKRKTLSTLKAPKAQGQKTVSVEVRKKRTYIKRDPEQLRKQAELEAAEAALAPAPEETPEQQTEVPAVDVAEPAAVEAVTAEPEAEAEAAPAVAEVEVEEEMVEEMVEEITPSAEIDPEQARQAAAARRKLQEEEERAQREQQLQALKEKQRLEEQARAGAAAKPARGEEPSGDASKKSLGKKKKQKSLGLDDDQRTRRPGIGRRRDGGLARSKTHSANIQVRDEYEEVVDESSPRGSRRKARKASHPEHGRHGFEKPVEKQMMVVDIPEAITVGDLAQRMAVKAGVVIKALIGMGTMATINQPLDQDTATLVVEELGHSVKLVSDNVIEEQLEESLDHVGTLESRAPVVTVMGHVDHGKTSLLDYIRKSRVASGEAGGITQHIGAYHVETGHGMITFLDTPGHAAFTAMRARGAKSTDLVILVVAADDGVMPQTEEAVQHARVAGVPIIVAVNKIDKEGADPDRVKNELAAKDVIPEDWGGDVQFVSVSAHTGDGIEELLDAILLQAEILELKASNDVPAKGIVIESRLDKGRGPVASVLVQNGSLRQGDIVLAGVQYGRIRAMLDENGQQVDVATPSIPVQILGLDGTPEAGEDFAVVESEKRAREVAEHRNTRDRETRMARQQAAKLDSMFTDMTSGEKKVLNVVIKADVRGSLEAIVSALADLGNDEVQVNVVSDGVGGIAETDINLALTSSAVVFGFNVRADTAARKVVEAEVVDLRYYSVIYDLIDDVKQALTGMLAPELREEIVGVAEVRDVFRSPKFGQVAGCMVVEGTMYRNKPIRVLREDVVIYEGELESLRRFKDDVNDVRNGFECGIGVRNYNDVREGDKIEVFDTHEVARTL